MHDEVARFEPYRPDGAPGAGPELALDDVALIGKALCRASLAFVTLANSGRLVAPIVGPECSRAPIDLLLSEDLPGEHLVAPDLAAEPWTLGGRSAPDEPEFRFYAGVVLRSAEGRALGVLSVLDGPPRPEGLAAEQLEAFRALGRQAAALIAMRGALHPTGGAGAEEATRSLRQRALEVEAMFDRLRAAQQAGRVGSFEIEIESDLVYPSAQFCRLYGLAVERSFPARTIEALVPAEDRGGLSSRATRADGSAPLDVEYRIRRPDDGELRWIARRAEFVRDERGKPVRMLGVVQDVTEQKIAQQRQASLIALGDELREASTVEAMARAAAGVLGRLLAACRAGYAAIDEKAGLMTISQDWTAPETASVAGTHALAPFAAAAAQLKAGEVLAEGDVAAGGERGVRAYLGPGVRAQIQAPLLRNGQLVGVFFVHSAEPRDWTAAEIAFVRAVADRAAAAIAKAQAEDQQRLLNHELGHRIKNMLAVVQAIASQTLRDTAREEVHAFNQRVLALARAHEVLLQQNWASARIHAVTASVIELHGDANRFAFRGPDLTLGPKAALSLAMLLHELATNAAKYGALSSDRGRVRLVWRVAGAPGEARLRLFWRERGGPPVVEPTRRGFGSRLIRMGLVGSGEAEIRYDPAGLTAIFAAPMSLLSDI